MSMQNDPAFWEWLKNREKEKPFEPIPLEQTLDIFPYQPPPSSREDGERKDDPVDGMTIIDLT